MSNIADLRIQLKAEVITRRKSLLFWEAQPEMPLWPASGFSVDVRTSRIEALKTDIHSIEQAIAVVEDALAKGA